MASPPSPDPLATAVGLPEGRFSRSPDAPETPPQGAASAVSAPAAGVELTVVVPTYNERDNVAPLLARLEAALAGIAWEVIYVDDDSPDGTAAQVRRLARSDPRVRCLQRIGRRGLSSAVVEGMLASSAPYLAVIDADLQHDERLLPHMLAALKAEDLDIVVGSRHAAGGGTGAWERRRVAISAVATRLARLVVSADLSDPMSGFFMLSRPAFERSVRHLSGQGGFKILLDLFASTPVPFRFKELPYVFAERQHGESKLDSFIVWEYLMMLAEKLTGGYVPARFLSFAIVGGSGVAVHFATLFAALHFVAFPIAQAIAATVAMTSNFVLNNQLTYRDRRLKGRQFLSGLISFYAVCGLGAVANVGVASAVFAHHYTWWVSGLAGTAVGVVWNYAVSSVLTWRRR
jgi:dolichol-phosphate mannosyltransferase